MCSSDLIDRVSYGFVVDFLDFFITSNGIEKHYPAFNVADIAICVGVGLLILVELVSLRGAKKEPQL